MIKISTLTLDANVETPITKTYEGTLDFDALLTAIMNAHGPRLDRSRHKAEYWCYRQTQQVCRVGVACNWTDQTTKLGLLAFSFLPLSTCNPDEIIWIADVNYAEVSDNTTTASTATDALLIVSYRTEGVYPVVFPYFREASGSIAYEAPLFSGVTIPEGFVHLALRSIFFKEMSEEERTRNYEGRHLAAAMATAWEHEVVFPGEELCITGL